MADIKWPLPYNFKHVCDEKRYANLGLQASQFPFCDKSLPYNVRAKHLVSSMTLTEKVQQLGNNADGKWLAVAEGVPRLGIPPYNWWSEALHGVSYIGDGSSFDGPTVKGATSFPVPITTAAAFNESLEGAVRKGLIKESDVDEALINNYMVLLRLGWFDGNHLYDSLDASHVCSEQHKELAATAARQGTVLLKNNGTALPLNTQKFKKIAVVGPHANATDAMIGNYAGVPCRYVSPIDGFKKYAEVEFKKGCEDVQCHTETLIFHSMMAATEADATIIAVGLNLTYEREGWDRSNFDLPGYQNQLIERVSSVSKGPVILVLFSAGSFNISSFVNSNDVDAIIWAGYPGQEGGQAIADVVFGAYNPGGRLPVTWYPPEYLSQLPMTSQQFRPNDELGYPGRTYRFYNGTTLFPFGFGLSYTQFTYSFNTTQITVTKNLVFAKQCYNSLSYAGKQAPQACHSAVISDLDCGSDSDISVDVSVKNAGKVDGSDVIMLYSKHPEGLIGAPIKHLVAFQRVFVKAGESETVKFELNACKSLAFVTETAYEVLPQGEHQLVVGDQQMSVNVQLQIHN